MKAWKNRLSNVPKEKNLKERRRFNKVARQLRNDAFSVKKTYRLAGGDILPDAVDLFNSLEKKMSALFYTLKMGSSLHQVHLEEVLYLRSLLLKNLAVKELMANPKMSKGVFESLLKRGKQSLYNLFGTINQYRGSGLHITTLVLIAYLTWLYFSSPGMAAIIVPSPLNDFQVNNYQRIGDFTENEKFLMDAFSKTNESNRSAMLVWTNTLLNVVNKLPYQERFENDNARIWYADETFSTMKKKTEDRVVPSVEKDFAYSDFQMKVIEAIQNHPGFKYLSEDKQESVTSVEFRNDWEADEYHIWMKRILDGEVQEREVETKVETKESQKERLISFVNSQSEKEGIVFGNKYTVKKFKKQKSQKMIQKEADFQRVAAEHGVAPKVILVDNKKKFIVMERVAMRLIDFMRQRVMSTLLEKHQKQLIEAMDKLDRVGLLYNNGNILNLMVDQEENLKIIDFGKTRKITKKDKYKSPNGQITLPALRRDMKHYKIRSGHVVDSYIKKLATK